MTHDADMPDAEERTMRYVLGELAGDEAVAFERRLAGDPTLAAEVRRLRATLDLVPFATLTPPPPALRARVLEAAVTAAPGRRTPRRTPTWSHALAIAATLAALAFGLDAWRTRHALQDLRLQAEVARILDEPNVVLSFALAGIGPAAGAAGGVALDLDAKKGAVVIDHLPALPPGEIYRLWAKVGDRDVPCGDFRRRPDGSVTAQFAVPVDAYDAPIDALFLTVEPAGATGGPRGARLMVGT